MAVASAVYKEKQKTKFDCKLYDLLLAELSLFLSDKRLVVDALTMPRSFDRLLVPCVVKIPCPSATSSMTGTQCVCSGNNNELASGAMAIIRISYSKAMVVIPSRRPPFLD